jgi:hypothetical protein
MMAGTSNFLICHRFCRAAALPLLPTCGSSDITRDTCSVPFHKRSATVAALPGQGSPNETRSHLGDSVAVTRMPAVKVSAETPKEHGLGLPQVRVRNSTRAAVSDGNLRTGAASTHMLDKDRHWAGAPQEPPPRRVPARAAIAIAGNHVVLALGSDGPFVLLAHLRRGSVRVHPGESLRSGDQLGECGNSGNSTEPHVHVQVTDSTHWPTARGLPLAFRRSEDGPDAAQRGWIPAESEIVDGGPVRSGPLGRGPERSGGPVGRPHPRMRQKGWPTGSR